MGITRRELLGNSAKAAAVLAASGFLVTEAFGQGGDRYSSVFGPFDAFVESYMREMNAPGMTFVMADRDGVQRVVTYGFTDPELKTRVEPKQLFEIGSITKSFLALVILQLRDEGKLDLDAPITKYLPWFRIESRFMPVTTHHLLTHTSGLDSGPLFLPDPAAKHVASYQPGEHFHYNNMAFVAMGHLVETLSGESFATAFKRRIFEPLGMSESEPVITLDVRDRMAKNWWPFLTDRPYPRYGRLSEAPPLVMTDASGCIASTARDMGLYIQMLASGGVGPKGRVVSEASWALMTKPHIKADEFGPAASYGYGIAVDTLEGHKILRHTGGMVSFASAMQVDVDAGVGAFASINAMQGYRPNPVAQYAIQLMRAVRESKPLPQAPEITSAREIPNAEEYAGVYAAVVSALSPRERQMLHGAENIEVVRTGQRLSLVVHERIHADLIAAAPDQFVVNHPQLNRFLLVFGREREKEPKSRVVTAGWGSLLYANEHYQGPRNFATPAAVNRFVGHYRSENPWNGSLHIVFREGKLMIDGVVPLEVDADGVFYLRDEEWNTEWIRFYDVVNGKSRRLKLSGDDFWRVDAE